MTDSTSSESSVVGGGWVMTFTAHGLSVAVATSEPRRIHSLTDKPLYHVAGLVYTSLKVEKFLIICVSENLLSFSSLLEYDGVYLFHV
jgi:hypothetical protein